MRPADTDGTRNLAAHGLDVELDLDLLAHEQ